MNTESPFSPEEELKLLRKTRITAPHEDIRDSITKRIEQLKKKIAENDG